MTNARARTVLAVCVLAVAAALAGAAHAASGWASCGSDPPNLKFDVQAQGLGCSAARSVVKKLQRFSKVKAVAPKEYSYTVDNGWLCYYLTKSSPKATDNELAYFDCRAKTTGGAASEIRWTDAAGVKPVELLPTPK